MYNIIEILNLAIEQSASDVHLHVGVPPTLRIDGMLTPIAGPNLTPQDTAGFVQSIASPEQQEVYKKNGGADFAYSHENKARFRVSIYHAKQQASIVLRLIPNRCLSLSEIGLPPKIPSILEQPRGLFLVTGPTGSGKSSSLAAMVDYINASRSSHIITIEDPIEYYHVHKQSLITQREIGDDVPSFSEAIRKALRQDPDIIMVGEMRDLETIAAAITAAETGHLVFATLHTNSAAKTIDRIIDAFPSGMKEMIRVQVSTTLLGVLSQTLCRKSGGGRIAAFELMLNTPAIGALIRANKTFRIPSEIQTGSNFGMCTLDASLGRLLAQKVITFDEARRHAQDISSLKSV